MGTFLRSAIPYTARIIEIGATDSKLGRYLVKHGWTRYLGLVENDPAEMEQAAGEGSDNSPSLYPFSHPDQIQKNNADVLILSGRFARYIWTFLSYSHAQYVAWSPRLNLNSLIGFLGMLKVVLRKRVNFPRIGILELEPGNMRLFFFLEVRQRRPLREKRFISPIAGVERFFQRLKEERANYVVLRWFEDLPVSQPRKDIDILVSDADVEIVDRLTLELPGIIQCDVYSVSGLPGSHYMGDPHLPPHMAEPMLARAVWWKNCYRVPCAEDYFLGLAYHAIYHKGEKSGIPSTTTSLKPSKTSSHDYTAVLGEMARSLNIDVDITMEGLDRYLDSRGLRPHLDTLVRFTRMNGWVSKLLSAEMDKHKDHKYEDVCNFYIRDRAVELGYEKDVVAMIEAEGFIIVEEFFPSEEETAFLVRNVRGGNWGPGKAPRSGGKPAIVVVAFDPSPIAPSESTISLHPATQNERIRLTKKRVRNEMNRRLPPAEHCNMVHTSDNGTEALSVLRSIIPDRIDTVMRKIDDLRQTRSATEPPLRIVESGAGVKGTKTSSRSHALTGNGEW